MKIAVEGCAHGELERVYKTLEVLQRKHGVSVDLLVCCGDFQATRHADDMDSMAVPPKFRCMGSFYKYYTGELVAPVLTLFIGGNHEASAHMQEISYGGWAAPNIYYIGAAGVVDVAGVRIGGLSGIYKGNDYMRGRHERPPYTEQTKRSVYHVRQLEVFRLKQLKEPVTVMLSHDWPQGIEHNGNLKKLLRFKPFFEKDINEHRLGSPPAAELLNTLQPPYWFSAHLHCKFAAVVEHATRDSTDGTKKQTKFLSLDKCLPRRRFLQILDIPHDDAKPIKLCYDLEWLTVLQLTNHLLNVNRNIYYLPSAGPTISERSDFSPTDEEKSAVLRLFENGDLTVPENFAPCDTYKGYANPQTRRLCDLLGIDDPLALVTGQQWAKSSCFINMDSTFSSSFTNSNEDDISSSSLLVGQSKDDTVDRQDSRTGLNTSLPLVLPEPKSNSVDANQCSPVHNTSLSLVLPEPVNVSSSEQLMPLKLANPSDNDVPTKIVPEEALDLSGGADCSTLAANTDDGKCANDDASFKPKKFKRRNYQQQNDDSD